MSNTMAIAGRQFRSYFNGPIAYIVIVFSLVLLGVAFYWWPLAFFLRGVVTTRDFFAAVHYINYFTIPALAMGLIAEEKASGTLETLMTMPVSEAEVVVGKFLGALGVYGVYLTMTLAYPISISRLGDLDMGPVFSGYVGLLLQGSALIAVGLMASSLTRTQLVALFLGWFISLTFAALDLMGVLLSPETARLFSAISFDFHLADMRRGVIAVRDVLFFLSVITVSLMVSYRSLESRRWS